MTALQSLVESSYIHWKTRDDSNRIDAETGGYWLFDPPRLLQEFFMTIKVKSGETTLGQILSEIEVLKPCELLFRTFNFCE